MQQQARFQQEPRDPGVRKLIRYNEKIKTTFSCSSLKMAHRKVWLDFNGSCSFSRDLRITPLLFMAKPARTETKSNIFIQSMATFQLFFNWFEQAGT